MESNPSPRTDPSSSSTSSKEIGSSSSNSSDNSSSGRVTGRTSDSSITSTSSNLEGKRGMLTRAQQSLYAGEDVDDKIDQTGCSSFYELLTDCLGQYDRDWTKCQKELQAFRRCCRANRVPGA